MATAHTTAALKKIDLGIERLLTTSNRRHLRCGLQLHLSARRESNEHGNGTGDKELQKNNSDLWSDEMSGHMSVKTNFPVLSAVTLCFFTKNQRPTLGNHAKLDCNFE